MTDDQPTWEDPQPPVWSKYRRLRAQLRERPREWAVVTVYESDDRAQNARRASAFAASCRTRRGAWSAFEMQSRVRDDGTAAVYARFIGR